MKKVGLRDLKNRLSAYVRLVRRGQSVLVTDRGQVVAELRSPGVAASDLSDRSGFAGLAGKVCSRSAPRMRRGSILRCRASCLLAGSNAFSKKKEASTNGILSEASARWDVAVGTLAKSRVQPISGTRLDFRIRPSLVTSRTRCTRLVAAMISSAGSPRKSSCRIARQTSSVRGQT